MGVIGNIPVSNPHPIIMINYHIYINVWGKNQE